MPYFVQTNSGKLIYSKKSTQHMTNLRYSNILLWVPVQFILLYIVSSIIGEPTSIPWLQNILL